jgi:Uma2 family endonuclease
MATPTLVPVEAYLARIYHPDREYVDGIFVERNLGERDHSRLQALLATYLVGMEEAWDVITLMGQRVQVSATRIRIPDLCLLAADDPNEPIVHKAPIVCIEILSPEDRMSAVEEKIQDYFNMGVRHRWVIDPERLRAFDYTPEGKSEAVDGVLRVSDSEIVLPINDIFDKLPRG